MTDGQPNDWDSDIDSKPLRGAGGGIIFAWANRILSAPAAIRFALSIALLVFVAALDAATGPEISFSVFYLIPVAFAGGFISRRAGWVAACMSAAAWGYLDATSRQGYSAAWIPYWNSGVRLGFFLIVNELIDMLRGVYARIRELSRTDTLTGIANGHVFQEHAEQMIAQARRNGRPFTITYVDLDRFKRVNDELGHAEGDRLLRTVSVLIEDSLRTTDVVARLGGDEFGILMPDTGVEQAKMSLERIAAAITHGVEDQWEVGATFGAVTFSTPPDNVDFAVHQADALMYRGKAEGRGRILQATWPESGSSRD